MLANAETDIIANLAAKIELIPSLEHGLVAIARNLPHHDLVTLADKCSGQSGVFHRSPPHMHHRVGMADHFGGVLLKDCGSTLTISHWSCPGDNIQTGKIIPRYTTDIALDP